MPRKLRQAQESREPVEKLGEDPRFKKLLKDQADDDTSQGGEGSGGGTWIPPYDPETLYQVFLRIHEQHRGLKEPPRNALQNDVPIDPDLAPISQQDIHPLQKSAYFSGMSDNPKESMIPSENTDPNVRNEYNMQLRKRLEIQKQLKLNMTPTPRPY